MIYALADCRITEDISSSLKKYADDILLLPPHPKLAPPVASHPDMLLWIYKSTVVTFESYLDIASDVFDKLKRAGHEIRICDCEPSANYPLDVALNCAVLGDNIICNKKYVCNTIKNIALENDIELIHSRQGYAKCATVTVSANALITADPSVFKATVSQGADALKIREGSVLLDGYDHGFIGGASGIINDSVVFCGDLELHPDHEKIVDFCESHGKKVVSLSSSPLYDYGTIFFA